MFEFCFKFLKLFLIILSCLYISSLSGLSIKLGAYIAAFLAYNLWFPYIRTRQEIHYYDQNLSLISDFGTRQEKYHQKQDFFYIYFSDRPNLENEFVLFNPCYNGYHIYGMQAMHPYPCVNFLNIAEIIQKIIWIQPFTHLWNSYRHKAFPAFLPWASSLHLFLKRDILVAWKINKFVAWKVIWSRKSMI